MVVAALDSLLVQFSLLSFSLSSIISLSRRLPSPPPTPSPHTYLGEHGKAGHGEAGNHLEHRFLQLGLLAKDLDNHVGDVQTGRVLRRGKEHRQHLNQLRDEVLAGLIEAADHVPDALVAPLDGARVAGERVEAPRQQRPQLKRSLRAGVSVRANATTRHVAALENDGEAVEGLAGLLPRLCVLQRLGWREKEAQQYREAVHIRGEAYGDSGGLGKTIVAKVKKKKKGAQWQGQIRAPAAVAEHRARPI